MSNLFYPLDESGQSPDNLVTAEFQSMVTLENDNRIIVPNATPFFSGGLKVIHWPSGKELVEGSDFYLGYRYREMENENSTPLYGCLVITNLGLAGSFELEYQTIGGNYIKPQPKVLEYLTNYLTNPRITDWEKVLNKPPSNPVKEHRYSHHDHVNLDGVENELMNLHDAIERYRQSLGEDTFNGLTIRLQTLEAQMVASGLNAHQYATDDPHDTTHTQTGALGLNDNAVNAIKAFNKTLTEFTQYCYDNGVTQNDLDTLLPLSTNHELLEHLVLPTTSYIRDVNGKVSLDIGNALAKLITDGAITFSADNTLNGNGRSVLKAGNNKLEVVSTGQGIDADSFLYNGSVVIHTGNVKRLMVAVNDAIYYIAVADGSNTKASGNGTPSNPLRIDGDLPTASTSVRGETTISKTVNSDNNKAIASSKLADITSEVVTKLDNTVTINGHLVKDSPVLTSTDIGLPEVDNTNDLEKEISIPQQSLLDNYISGTHRHSASDIYVPLASASQQGYGAYSADGAAYGGGDGELSTINWYREKFEEAVIYRDSTLGGVPSDLLPVVSYGTPDYLPIPATGYFGGSGFGGNGFAAVMEAGKRVVFLRAGKDYFERALYYHVVKLTDDDQLEYQYALTTIYRPKLMTPDEIPVQILSHCNTAMHVQSSTGQVYIIEFNDTMDASKHRVTPVTRFFGKMVDAGDRYCFTGANISSSYGLLLNLQSVMKSQLGATTIQDSVVETLTGNRHNGTPQSASDFYYVDSQKTVSAATGNDVCVVDDDFGRGGNIRHATQNILLGYQDGKIRFYFYQRAYFSNSQGSVSGPMWNVSCTVDLKDNNRVVFDVVPDFPVRITTAGAFNYGNMAVNTSNAYPGGSPNNVAFGAELGNGYEVYNWQQGAMSVPYVQVAKRYDPNVTWFESLDMTVRSTISLHNHVFSGKTFSGVGGGIRGFAPLIDNKVFVRPTTGEWMIAEVDPDSYYQGQGDKSFGYTTNSALYSEAESVRILRLPYCFDTPSYNNAPPVDERQRGAIWWSGNLTCDYEWDGNSFSGSSVCAQSVYDELLAKALADATADTPEVHHSHMLFIYSTDIPEVPMVYQYARTSIMSNGSKRCKMYVGKFDCNSRQTPTSITVTPEVFYSIHTHSSALSLSVSNWTMEGLQVGRLKNGDYAFVCNLGAYVGYVGNGGALGFGFMINPDTQVITNSKYWANHGYRSDGYKLIGSKGMYASAGDSSGTTVLGSWCDQDWNGISSNHVLWSSVAVGNWTFFISSTVNTYAKGNAGALAAVSYELDTMYPTNHANNKFYLYFNHSTATTQGYGLTTELIPDSNDTTYLGVVETDANGITLIDIRSVLKWGVLKELSEHEADKGAHGYGAIDKSTFNLDLIENKSPTVTLSPPTFAEVFDTWYRFSHNSANVYPANAGELTSWSFNEVNDSITCTVNSGTQIGFVSQEAYTDYEFDTLVSSTNGDDDWIGVVIAFETDEYGQEHSIVLNRATYANGRNITLAHRHVTIDGVVSITNIYLGGTPTPVGWANAGTSRLRVLREGDVYTIYVYSFTGAGYEQSNADAIVDTIILDLADHPTMEIFKNASRFGYVCHSQANSTWANRIRPDSDGRSYYGTNALLYNAYHGFGDAFIKTEDLTWTMDAPSAAGTHTSDVMTFDLPEGYRATDCDLAVSITGWDIGESAANSLTLVEAIVNEAAGTYQIRINQTGAATVRNRIYYSTFVIGRPSRL